MDSRAKPLPDMHGITVLQLVPSLEAGGAERTAVDIAAALVAAGGRALVATTGGRLVGELREAGAEWLQFPAATKNPGRIVWNAERIRRLIAAEGVDIVHARSRAPAWSGLMAARRAGVPFLTTYHGAYKPGGPLKTWYNSVMVRGDAVIANSRFTARRIEQQYPRAEGRIEVIYRGTDLDRFDPAAIDPARIAALRSAWGIAPGRRIVLLPARLTGWKGQEVLIDAAALLADRGVADVDYVLAGDAQGRTAYLAGLEARIAARGLVGRVHVVGHCSDMPAANMAADVVVVPSTEPEAFGRTAVEAQAAGRPVVVSDIGATPETVLAPPDCAPGQRTGWRVRPGDAVALAAAVEEALALGPEARAALGARARAHARGFGLEAMTGATLALYRRLLRRANAA
ncbi:glycosyltransferase involved in cell wall biosynthesis [Tepidamorphus gemmatus]|uniref:Glycosyltransferase involved in cell wall biosynthesis n=1 Tax=Tepidamorphus gemmatus TaxID=747076 RepID=A0A4R3M942_9HYPH|nr:glycosyltransferase family 4 protein [Tepidamorphus gemmatus]TCT08809.1 glycosyltransferase involved in cell wall biosynthesis [Tepidamorphus gemmatus]